jgi:hypothetical protein
MAKAYEANKLPKWFGRIFNGCVVKTEDRAEAAAEEAARKAYDVGHMSRAIATRSTSC